MTKITIQRTQSPIPLCEVEVEQGDRVMLIYVKPSSRGPVLGKFHGIEDLLFGVPKKVQHYVRLEAPLRLLPPVRGNDGEVYANVERVKISKYELEGTKKYNFKEIYQIYVGEEEISDALRNKLKGFEIYADWIKSHEENPVLLRKNPQKTS